MINIIEAGKYIKRENMLTLITDLKTYTFRNKMSIAFQRFLSISTSVMNFFLKIFGKNIKKYEISEFEARYEENFNELMSMDNETLYSVMIEQILKSIGFPAGYRKNSDVFSANLVNYAVKGFRRNLLKGFSISEKVEYIFEKYPHMKNKDEKKRLAYWIWLSAAMLLLCFLFSRFVPVKRMYCVVLGGALEIIFALWVRRKIKIGWAIRYVWLARTEYGRKLVESKLVLNELSDSEDKEARENLKLLHTYLWMLKLEKNTLAQLQKEKEDNEKRVDKNLMRMSELLESDNSDTYRMRNSLAAENETLKQLQEEVAEKIYTAEQNIKRIAEVALEEKEKCVEFYQGVWKKYTAIMLKKDVLIKLVDNLCYEDLIKVEQRIYELNYTKNPMAIAEHKGGRNYLSFRTEQGDVASLYLECGQNDEKTVIEAFAREDEFKIIPLTREDMGRIIERKNVAGNSVNQDVLQYRKRIEELSAETQKLREEKCNIDIELQNRMKEIGDMAVRMTEDAKRLKQLESELERVYNDKEQAEELVKEYEKQYREFLQKSDEVDEKKIELAKIKKRYDELTIELREKANASECIQKELEERNKVLQDNITNLESSLKMQIGVADELRKRKHTDEQALRKYEELIKQLEINYKNAKGELEKLNDTKEEYLKKTREDEALLLKYKGQLERAQEDARKSLEAMKEAQKNVSSEKYNSVYKRIRKKFPQLSSDALAFFATAEQFYTAFGDNDKVDYSMIIVEYCKVLEVTLWIYLSKSEEYRAEVSKCLKSKRGKTLGSAAHITAEDKRKSLGKYNEDIFAISRIRNEGAHKGRMGKTKIDRVKSYLWTSDILIELTNER